ncbi:MAG: phage head morphogenesis protein [Gammaproteobacteria bacterium]|nr:phage head morphogenesis protein [Gammaproteobacteria bacterium]
MPEPRLGAVPFTEAIEYFRRKINLPTRAWSDLQEDAHARAFVVAGATKADLLADIRAAVDDALAEGTTITDFRKRFDEIVERHGWSYRGKRGWRTRVMFDTNIRTAHAAGRWQQIQRTKARRPWLIYQTAGDERVRPLHQTWHHITLPADDPGGIPTIRRTAGAAAASCAPRATARSSARVSSRPAALRPRITPSG